MDKPTRLEMEELLIAIWNASYSNWVYSTIDEKHGRIPAGWVISSGSGVMGKLKDVVERIDEGN